MASIAKLAVKLVGDTISFERNMLRASKTVAAIARPINALYGSVDRLQGLYNSFSSRSLNQFISGGFEAAISQLQLSRQVNASAVGLSGLQHAMRGVNGDTNEVGYALADLNAYMVSAATGGIEAERVLQRLGTSSERLLSLQSDQAFIEVAEGIARQTNATQRAALATQVFGDRAAALLPLLARGRAGIADATAEARRMGLAMDAVQLARVENAHVAMSRFWSTLNGIRQTITVALAPYITLVLQRLEQWGIVGPDAVDGVRAAMAWCAEMAVRFANSLQRGWFALQEVAQGCVRAFGTFMRLLVSIAGAIQSITDGVHTLSGGLTPLVDINTVGIRRLARQADELERSMQEALQDQRRAPTWGQRLQDMMDEVARSADQAAEAANRVRDAGGAVQQQRLFGQFWQEGSQVAQSMRTGLEQYNSELVRLGQLLEDRVIDWDIYARAVSRAASELERANALTEIKFTGAAQRHSAAAYSATINANKQEELRFRENPQERLRRIAEEARRIQEQSRDYLREIARATGRRDPAAEIAP